MDPVIQNCRAELDVRRGHTPTLHVHGEIVSDHPILATLTAAPKQGTIAQDLFLTLSFEPQTIEKTRPDNKTQIHFKTPANQGQYTRVTIFSENRILQRLDVIEIS